MAKLPTVPPPGPVGMAKLWKGTPLMVVLATPVVPTLNAPTSAPLVLTSLSPVIFCGPPHTMVAARAVSGTSSSSDSKPKAAATVERTDLVIAACFVLRAVEIAADGSATSYGPALGLLVDWMDCITSY